ncbi:MAG: transglutaminase-like domain-containing protein [Bacteroidota bacterium]
MRQFIPAIVLAMIILTSCNVSKNKHLIGEKEYRDLVHKQFLNQKELAKGRDSVLFEVFNQDITVSEKEGLEFLYAFMPLSDLAMNTGEYNLKQVRTALEAKKFFTWGNEIPENVFLHFVLPYRVNNEYTDTARQVFFNELKDRIKGLNMTDAALEVNHWCHEKVNYKSTDERTSGPLTTVRTAFGRCGEESTFTAAALRSVCIPARQVYTPRWAHTDDNHAWVEVWIDGKWHFLGACEPEPALDMAWFAEPVKRAMMTHTFVYGQYSGNEEVLEKNERFTRLNLLANYTKTKNLPVRILNPDGKPVEKARVEYSLYNYAEFYPVATKYTDEKGICNTATGFGDLLIWASRDGLFGYQIAEAGSSDTIVIKLNAQPYNLPDQILTLTPPSKQQLQPSDQSEVDQNNRRLQREDSIRNATISTFTDSVRSVKIAVDQGLDPGKVWSFLSRSRGNSKEIIAFIKGLSESEKISGVALLDNISEKDLHDITSNTLNDHLKASGRYIPETGIAGQDLINSYVYSPRIGREMVTSWRSSIQQFFTVSQAENFRENPAAVVDWISHNINIDTVSNYYNVPISPEGVLQLKLADKYSRNLLFVAICRSFGIPSRLEPATRVPQFMAGHEWNDVKFGKGIIISGVKGEIELVNQSEDKNFIPQYYTHFTIARFDNGRFSTLDYEFDASLKTFPCRLSVDTGYYRLITGTRQSDGSVSCRINYFRVKSGELTKAIIGMASPDQQTGTLGKADLEAGFKNLSTGKNVKLHDFSATEGLVVAVIDPGKEPTRHLMEDIKTVKKGLDEWGGQILFIVAKDKLNPGFNPAVYKSLPDKSVFGSDTESEVSTAVSTVCSISGSPQLPVIVFVNNKGEISWHSEGYSIGLGDQLLKQIKDLGR